ncbi:hypothetical protein IFT66_23285 [Rhizobium sp. CFBP 13726]|uniref:hypothetical protein n=1 Tax=Rhizobium sp. CFBP 13726 TaxID=2775296 RepID=UPI0017862F27|nr:hypothetical protein [Rhizobium sp. CFBP 13726]MBD8654007.1 hypothetical protein [Rhizobium sp. CFBP 13726]
MPIKSATFDVQDICLRAKGLEPGVVTPEEVEFARSILRSRTGDIPGAVIVVGLCGETVDAPLLEAFLHGDDNNVYVEYSLKALCRYLRLTDRYRPLLREWMQMKDDEGYRRMAAINLAKEYFSGFEDRELGRYLIDVLCDLEDSCRSSVRHVFVGILKMQNQLTDPFGLRFEEWDEETTLIVNAAAQKFGYHDWKISHGYAAH